MQVALMLDEWRATNSHFCSCVATPYVAQLSKMPKTILSAMEFQGATRAAMRIAVASDAPQPMLYAARLLADVCLSESDEHPAWAAIPGGTLSGWLPDSGAEDLSGA